jgi:ABC-type antimicrobial peptide transport system permease subunit
MTTDRGWRRGAEALTVGYARAISTVISRPPSGRARAIALGAATTGYAITSEHPVVIRLAALAGGIGVALAVGAVAGVYPAVRAARLAPTDALRAT